MTVRIGFSTSKNNVISRIIRAVTKSRVSHVWLIIENAFLGKSMVMEATKGGFKLTSFSRFAETHDIVEIITPQEPLDEGVRVATDWLGGGYDYTGLIGAFFVQIGKWLKMKWRNPFDTTHAMFCSESVVFVLKAAKYPGSADLVPSATSPQDLLDFFTKEKRRAL